MRTIVFFAIIALLAFAGCDGNPTQYERIKYLGAQEKVTILNNELSLDVYLQRDFMPISPPDGHPLRTSILIYDINTNLIAEGINADSVWLFCDDDSWGGLLNGRPNQYTTDSLYFYNEDGPKWDPEANVDVYVRVKHFLDTYYLKLENVDIQRTL